MKTLILVVAVIFSVSATAQKQVVLSGAGGGSAGGVSRVELGDTSLSIRATISGTSASIRAALVDSSGGIRSYIATREAAIRADFPSGVSPVTMSTLTDGATVTWNYSTAGAEAKVTLGGNRSLSITNLPAGEVVYLSLEVIQDGSGSRTLNLPASTKVVNGGAGAITLTTTPSSIDIITFRWNGTTLFATYGTNFN